jgi:hypothetical protein
MQTPDALDAALAAALSMSQPSNEDARARPSNVVYGYFCRRDDQPMTETEAERLIGYVSVGNY